MCVTSHNLCKQEWLRDLASKPPGARDWADLQGSLGKLTAEEAGKVDGALAERESLNALIDIWVFRNHWLSRPTPKYLGAVLARPVAE